MVHWAKKFSDQNATALGEKQKLISNKIQRHFLTKTYDCCFDIILPVQKLPLSDKDSYKTNTKKKTKTKTKTKTKRDKYLSKNSHCQAGHQEAVKVGQQVALDWQD